MSQFAIPDMDRKPTQQQAPVVVWDCYRIRFAKTGLLRWIGHRDLLRLWERILRRRELQPRMTTGFHRKGRISFPSALALGVEGLDKVVAQSVALSFPSIRRRDRFVCVTQAETDGASLKGNDLLDAMNLQDLLPSGGIIRRTHLYLTDEAE